MDENDPVMWPSDDDESTKEREAPDEAVPSGESEASTEEKSSIADENSDLGEDALEPSNVSPASDEPAPWALPIRAAPILALQGEEVVECEIIRNLKILDLTGAGDLFASGFLHGYVNHLSIKESLEKGTQMSARVIQQIGARL